VRVIDSFENIAILENKTKIDVRRLMDSRLYTEYIDPNSFMDTSNAYNGIFEKIKNLPTEGMPYEKNEVSPIGSMSTGETIVNPSYNSAFPSSDEPVAYASSIEDEKAELAKKYGIQLDSKSALDRQGQAFAKILGDDQTSVQRVDIVRDNGTGEVISSEMSSPAVEKREDVQKDPYEMFRGIKRSVEFKLDLPLTNRIPKLEFIEMMEDSYDKSLIDFLAMDITNDILSNPEALMESIKEKIKDMVYSKKVKAAPKRTAKTAPKRTPGKAASKNDPLPIEREPLLAKDLEEMRDAKNSKKRTAKKEVEG
jgi:hypothetical protein